jgi:adenylate cyclase
MSSAYGQLIPIQGGTPIPLEKLRCVVGRAVDCDLVLPYRTVSSKHCMLEFRDGAWFVTDLASSNGIRIDGLRCREGRLSHGSILSIAEYRFEVATGSGPPSPAGDSALQIEPEENSEMSEFSDTQIPFAATAQPTPAAASAQNSAPQNSPPPGCVPLANLLPLDGGPAIPLINWQVLVGRSPVCNVVLPFPDVSGKHCQLEFQQGLWHVHDLGSRNGVRVDGKFESSVSLKPNSILSVAKHRFKIVYVPQMDDSECCDDPVATFDLDAVKQTDRVAYNHFPEATLAIEGASSGEHSADDARDCQ